MSGKRRYCNHCNEYVCRSTYFEHQMKMVQPTVPLADSTLQAERQPSVEGKYIGLAHINRHDWELNFAIATCIVLAFP